MSPSFILLNEKLPGGVQLSEIRCIHYDGLHETGQRTALNTCATAASSKAIKRSAELAPLHQQKELPVVAS